MGRLINGPNGPFIGKAGSFVGYTVNGVGYIKGLYKLRTKPPTEKEAFNQKKFAVAQKWLHPLTIFVRAGFRGYNERFQGFVAAKSYLMKNALKVIDDQIVIDPALVRISSGTLPLPENLECTFQEPDIFRFAWTPSLWETHGYDQLIVLVYDIENGQAYGKVYGKDRSSGEQLLSVGNPIGKTFHAYAGFIAADRSRQSDSVHFGKFEF
ncbi:DUF6266 family protein [Daejeonella sp. JGW-45]|uniref:DUF6266 family protein n=1 Tax=Daejeonella sp. JGW-45 TaxID=3034148 RepID=UPI0023EAA2E1|nr:DUF6266 family protein [Daejeonella sp. JGW-45]